MSVVKVPTDSGLVATHIMLGPSFADFSTILYVNEKGEGGSK